MSPGESLDEDVRQNRAEQAVEHDRLGEREAEPLDALELTTELGLPCDRLDHRSEDVADANAGAEGAETDAECKADGLAGLGDIAGRRGEKYMHRTFLLVFRLDRRADVDGGQSSKDEGLDRDDDADLEDVEGRREEHDRDEREALEDEHEPDEGQDENVPREHVREESDAQRDQAHELAEDLQWDDQE